MADHLGILAKIWFLPDAAEAIFCSTDKWSRVHPARQLRRVKENRFLLSIRQLLAKAVQFLQSLHGRQVVNFELTDLIQKRIFRKIEQ